jgi:hypothetical protein
MYGEGEGGGCCECRPKTQEIRHNILLGTLKVDSSCVTTLSIIIVSSTPIFHAT